MPRKPRDIDAELKALAERAKGLRARKIDQLGELVIATGAGALDAEILAGVLLAAVAEKAPGTREAWRTRGQASFRKQERQRKNGAGDPTPGTPEPHGSPASDLLGAKTG